ncbi:MAG: hypothetical protein QNJ47_25645 [Nostocaceae cyanobacterium]|nr:hypothetical protein [Nostocaceae cyanobacterium]
MQRHRTRVLGNAYLIFTPSIVVSRLTLPPSFSVQEMVDNLRFPEDGIPALAHIEEDELAN